MDEKDKDGLLYYLLQRIYKHGYVHSIDRALVVFLLGDMSVRDASFLFGVSTDAIYKHKSRVMLERNK